MAETTAEAETNALDEMLARAAENPNQDEEAPEDIPRMPVKLKSSNNGELKQPKSPGSQEMYSRLARQDQAYGRVTKSI